MRRQRDFIAAFALVVLYILGSHFVDDEGGWRAALRWDVGLFIIVIVASIYFRKVLLPALSFTSFSLGRLLKYLGMQAVLTAFVLITVSWLAQALGRDASYWSIYEDAPWPMLVAVLSMALAPAISEELAFRGILFGQLRTLTGPVSSVLVTGFLFALVHFSFLTMFWLVPAGLFFGWMRNREGIIWYGVICHFAHNAAVVIGEANGWW
ncbi:MAG TPA: type II CAAX endopeptidase family protein [Flavobacteriales bacterium]|nr:type II CAAX endopeptidase family protein [Flavobacteriales bacterium]